MQTTIQHIEDIVSKVGELAETKAEIWKLKATGKIGDAVSSIISIIAIAVFTTMAICVISVGVACIIGLNLNNYGYGFLIVGGFYALVGLLIFLFRKQWIKHPISNLIIDKMIK